MNEMTNYNGNTNNPFRIFDYKNLGSVRTYLDEKGEVWFCLKDVSNILGLNNHRQTLTRLNEKGVISNDTLTNGGIQRLIFIDEGNLYQLVLGSRKKEVKPFVDWVTREVLPSLRKNGVYDMRNKSFEEISSQYLTILSEKVIEIEKEVSVHTREIKNLNEYDIRLGTRMERLENDTNEMILENRRIEESLRYDFKTVAGFFKYIGIQPDYQEELSFRGVVEKYCLDNRIPYCKTYVDGFGEYICFPFDTLMEVYNESIHNN